MPKKKQRCSGSYGQGYHRRKSKHDWAGISLGDAFKNHLEYHLRIPAQRNFYQMVKKVQMAIAELAGEPHDVGFEPKVKPQLSPCYTTYPSTLAAYAAIGLTAFIEFETSVGVRILFSHLDDYLKNPAEADNVRADPEIYSTVAHRVTEYVQTRLLLESLSRTPSMSSVELYRLFSASHQNLRFCSLQEIVKTVILYGDVLPDWKDMRLHSLTRSLLDSMAAASVPFFEKLAQVKGSEYLELGTAWIRALCISIAKYLPQDDEDCTRHADPVLENPAGPDQDTAWGEEAERFSDQDDAITTDRIAPFGGPKHPFLEEPETAFDQASLPLLTKMMSQKGSESRRGKKPVFEKSIDEALNNFAAAVESAGGQSQGWEDMRSDLMERLLGRSVFREGPLQGSPAGGHEVSVMLDNGHTSTGEIFDRAVELSDDLPACEKLLNESGAVIDALKRSLYPNIRQIPVTWKFRSSGSLDPSRLAIADFSLSVFKRYRIEEQADRRGRPMLVIACDGSGSLDEHQMKMVKILASGWLGSTAGTTVQILAGLYHSGTIREGVAGPLVQWIYHPHKTPAVNRRDSMRALVSLPDSGDGVQSDALSIAFILDEAEQLAKGNMIYLILITDTKWNRSFQTERDGYEEVYSYFENAYKRLPGRLHTTLVALGVREDTGFEEIMNRIITVSAEEIRDYAAVAGKIGDYVASCIRERGRLIARQ